MTGIIQFLTAFNNLVKLGTQLSDLLQDQEFNAWVGQLQTTVTNLQNAKTDEDRIHAAQALAQLTRSL